MFHNMKHGSTLLYGTCSKSSNSVSSKNFSAEWHAICKNLHRENGAKSLDTVIRMG